MDVGLDEAGAFTVPDRGQATLTLSAGGSQPTEHALVHATSCCYSTHLPALYDSFHAVGLQYGPGYRTLIQAWGGAHNAVARLKIRSETARMLHPADLDDALCTTAVVGSSGGGGTRLPFAVDDALLRDLAREPWTVRAARSRSLSCHADGEPRCVRADCSVAGR